jgi:hypothetical protein
MLSACDSQGHSAGVVIDGRKRSMPVYSGRQARRDLEASIDHEFSQSTQQDMEDRQQLHAVGGHEAGSDILGFLDQLNQDTRSEDLADERRLASGGGDSSGRRGSQKSIVKMEQRDSERSEAEYQNALRDALYPSSKKH